MTHVARDVRMSMYRTSKNCHWCGVLMSADFMYPPTRRADVATIDHLYPKGHPLRLSNPDVVVLACWLCNQDRAFIAQEFRKIIGREMNAECGY